MNADDANWAEHGAAAGTSSTAVFERTRLRRVRGLRLWLTRTAAVVGLVAATVGVVSSDADAKPKGDAVLGAGTAGTGTFAIDAAAKKTKASGTALFSLAIGEVVGRVTCVQVQDGLAGISGTLEPGTTAVDPAQSPGFILYVADGSVTQPGVDLLQLRFEGFVPEDCTPQFPLFPAGVTSGDLVLIDGG